jgi:hypothetical protein
LIGLKYGLTASVSAGRIILTFTHGKVGAPRGKRVSAT